jgi:cytosine/creatinine deaminase
MKPALTAHEMLAVAIEQARAGLGEGGIPVGGAIFRTDGTLISVGRNRLVQNGDPSMHGETDAFRAAGRQRNFRDLILVTTLAPCWYCTGLIYQFRFKQIIVGDSVNAQGGLAWLREQKFDIVELASHECIDMMGKFRGAHPSLWDECIGDG